MISSSISGVSEYLAITQRMSAASSGLVRLDRAQHASPCGQALLFLLDIQRRGIRNVVDHATKRIERRDVALAFAA